MRETDRIANEKFDGSIRKTIQYIVNNYDDKAIDNFYNNEWNERECDMADVYLATKSLGHLSVDELHQLKKDISGISDLQLSKEDVKNAEKNPFKAKMTKDFLKLLLVNSGIMVLGAAAQNFVSGVDVTGISAAISSIFTTSVAVDAGPNIVNYFKFKKAKKELQDSDLNLGEGKKM